MLMVSLLPGLLSEELGNECRVSLVSADLPTASCVYGVPFEQEAINH